MPHAPFPPSSAKRWLNCPGSFALGLQRAQAGDNEYSIEGTRLHSIAAGFLAGDGKTYVLASDADLDTIRLYLDYAAKRTQLADAYAVEETIIHSPLLYGTPDLLLFFKKQSMLEVVDLKTGAGIMVEPEENDQLLCYAFMENPQWAK